MAFTTELVLIRHGETAWNKEHRLQGQAKPGPPLNDMGIQQTRMVSSAAAAAAAVPAPQVSTDSSMTPSCKSGRKAL
jgi:broad specificity phosphatase PhoE